jgi:hypothetical protein
MLFLITLVPAIRPPRSRAAVLWSGGGAVVAVVVADVVVGPAVAVVVS